MAQTSLAKPTWTQQLYAAFDMFEMDDKQGCITILQAIVSEPGVPRYRRIQALVAIATAVDDWYDAEVRLVRHMHDEKLLTMTGIPTGGRNPVQIDAHPLSKGM